jgi:glutamine---fructose-6-phosphate transaminase (isomerizing)
MNKFLKEIEEQPKALADTLNFYLQAKEKERLNRIVTRWASGKFNKIIFTGMGSSYFIAYSATCLFNQQGITSFAINAGELLHYQSSLLDKTTLLVCISQSGESYEIVKILEKIPSEVTVIGICNESESTLVKKAQESLLSKAGKEEMTSTKTYISTYLAMYILSLAFGGKYNDSSISEIEKSIQIVSNLLKNRDQWLNDAAKIIAHVPFVQLIGRGPVYATVQQSALMFMEATRNPASALLGGEFRHGPMEMVKKDFRAVVFAPAGTTYIQSIAVTSDILKYGGKVLLLTDEVPLLKNDNLFSIVFPCPNEALFPILSAIPMQLIVNQWSIEEKNEPGNFTRGAKITSIE